tara:strand:- start:52 stop:924 length:873 start_codon:yes stop_codon:yes gene_type:complete
MSITRQNLSVIIVSYKSDYVIENCINSIHSEIEIVVVDNSNNDQLREKIETKYKNVKYILSKENLGMGAGNNLGIKNVNKDFVLILNPDVTLEKSSIDEMIIASQEIENFGIIAPLSDKSEYPNYTLKKMNEFDPIKPFKVKSVDGYAMLLNLKKLKKLNDFYFFDENFFLYLENEDLCLRLEKNDENIYIVPKSRIHHLGGKAVDPKYKNEIEYLRNWHWMWSKFYFNKKHYGYLVALLKVFKNLISAKIKFFYYLITFNTFKRKIYQMRLLGLMSSMIGKNSYYRPNI